MKVSEEEELVPDDRSAKSAAEHVPAQFGLGKRWVHQIVRPAVGIQNVIAEKLPNIAMVFVRARFDDGVHNSAFEIAELCRGVARDEVELLDRIGSRRVAEQIVRYLVVVHAVEQEVVRLLAVAVDEGTATVSASIVSVIETAGIGRYRAWRKQGQLDIVAGGKRHIVVSCSVDNRVHLRGLSLENGSSRGHFHRLGGLTNFHRYVYAGDLIQSEHEWRNGRHSEPGFLNLDGVRADRQLGDTVKAAGVRHGGIRLTAFLRRRRNCGSG